MPMTNYLRHALLNHTYRNTPYTSPTNVYVALFTSAPSVAGGGTEVSGGSYARQAPGFGAPASGQIANGGLISFPQATADWGTITHVAIFDALSGGNMLQFAELPESKVIDNGDTLRIPIANLIQSLS